jgi:hypothetical protein
MEVTATLNVLPGRNYRLLSVLELDRLNDAVLRHRIANALPYVGGSDLRAILSILENATTTNEE